MKRTMKRLVGIALCMLLLLSLLPVGALGATVILTDHKQIVDAAYELAPGERLPYDVTLTGKIISVDTPYDTNYKNITVTIAVEGREDKPITCYRLKGTGTESLKVGDTITVSGIIKNYQYSSGECEIEFDAGCTLENVIPGVTVPEDPEPIEPQPGKLYCLPPADWDECYVYTWDDNYFYGDWPGTLMTKEANGLWSCDVPSGDENVIFNCGEGGVGNQTEDMLIPTDNRVLYVVDTQCWMTFDNYNGSLKDPQQIVDEAYALSVGEELSYEAALTGTVISVDTPYDWLYLNITVTIAVEGCETKPIQCYRVKGNGAGTLKIGDIITVTGTITNYNGNTIRFKQGCTLDHVIKGDEYRVVGNADFMGLWDAASDAGLMECVSLGVYQKDFYDVPFGTYQFQLTKNGVWDDSVDGPYNDCFCFAVTKPGIVSVTYTAETGEVDITVENGVVGDTTGYRMLTVVAPYSWEKAYAYTFAPESLGAFPGTELAIVGGAYKQLLIPGAVNLLLSGELANGSRQLTDAITLEANGLDATVTVASDGSYTVSYAPLTIDFYSVVGNSAQMGYGDPASNAGRMSQIAPGVYQRCFVGLSSGMYQFRIVKNGSWDDSISNADGNDFTFVVFDTCDVTVTYTLETGAVDIAVENGIVGNDLPDRTLTVIAPYWNDVHAYTWEPATFGEWPGAPMPMVNGIYQMNIPGLMTNLIINGLDNSSYRDKTDDLVLTLNGQDVLVIIDAYGGYEIKYGQDISGYVPESLALVGSGLPGIEEWNPADPEGDMSLVSGSTFVYEKVLDVTAGTSMTFRFVGNDCWDDQWNFAGNYIYLDQSVSLVRGSDCQDLQLSVSKDCRLRFTLDLSGLPFGYSATLCVKQEPLPNATRKLTVTAPSTWTTVEAYTWDPATMGDFPGTSMTKSGGVYELTILQNMTNLLLSGLKSNGSRSITGNITLEANDRNVNIVIAEDGSYTVSYDYDTLPTKKLYCLPPASWDVCYIYTWTSPTYSIKVEHYHGDWPGTLMTREANGLWSCEVPGEAENVIFNSGYGDQTEDLLIPTDDKVLYVVDAQSWVTLDSYIGGNIPEKPVADTYRVVGNASWMGNWNEASDQGLMTEVEPGVYQKEFSDVPSGAYEFKITKNGKWDYAIGAPTGGNIAFTVLQTCQVTVTYLSETGEVSVALDNFRLQPGDVSGDGKLNTGDVAKLYAHIRGTSLLTAAGALSNADFTGDGKINIGDTARIYARIRGTDTTD